MTRFLAYVSPAVGHTLPLVPGLLELQAAREAGVSTMTMNRWAHVHGIPLRSRGTAGHRQYLQREFTQDTIDPEWLFEQYVVQRRAMPELARELGVGNASLYSWARLHGIPVRPRGRPRPTDR